MNSMIIAASGFMPIATNILLVIIVAVALLLCLVVLMQRPKQEGLGAAFGGGMTDQAFGARTTDVLQKGTVWLGTLFFVLALSLQVLVAAQNSGQNIEKEVKAETEEQTDDAETAEEVKKILEEITPTPEETSTPEETPATEESAPVETPATEESAPVETPATEEANPAPVAVEAAPAVPAEATPAE
ncbi:preprotein translocase subunit SecG [Rubritalea profundi]|uniref:Protein-export membrane protein SecG n=1 Tax=Rubritalea profundi TaxID=1658618 RepID=A0A2S7TZ51_9BACT|nr:preprotein translocase subunit SecG [Rubritalea profundi]PQJ27491.1 preprotein translocase subunit SecG [Rubritalea profundi]